MSQSSLRARAARSVLESVPLIMRTVGHGVRHGGGEVSPQQYRLFNIIGAHPQTPTRLARFQGVTPATATATVSTLEQRGWVIREHDAEDRRRVIVSLTGEGRAVLDRARVLEAHKDPSKYPDLIVRVTGFSAYFASLSPEFRQMVIDRVLQDNDQVQ